MNAECDACTRAARFPGPPAWLRVALCASPGLVRLKCQLHSNCTQCSCGHCAYLMIRSSSVRAVSRCCQIFRHPFSQTTQISLRHITADILKSIPRERTRNLSIIAHVDHGKSTLSDRLMELTLTISSGGRAQYLDKLQVERERGITIKAQTVSMLAEQIASDGSRELYLINLIDTPGHVDFSYEVSPSHGVASSARVTARLQVSRSLHACQGVVLVVDASQGVQAQTVANYHAATACGVAVVPVVNKIDLPHADVERVRAQLNTLYGIDPGTVIPVSAKSGLGVSNVLDAIINRLPPPPPPTPGAPFKALLFDMWYDDYKVLTVHLQPFIMPPHHAVHSGGHLSCSCPRWCRQGRRCSHVRQQPQELLRERSWRHGMQAPPHLPCHCKCKVVLCAPFVSLDTRVAEPRV